MAPESLERILGRLPSQSMPSGDLLVGFQSKDDAAVVRLDDDRALIATTDFFMPIVDDPFDFGKVAAANALSDVYAMGGTPLLALGILGWPINILAEEHASEVLRGAQEICREAGIPLAGGHSIENPEPVFGLSVNGIVSPQRLKRNDGGKPGDILVMTKPLGIGLYTTARKRGLSRPEEDRDALELMCKLNDFGSAASAVAGVHAQTDVTGFGLLGHLFEICTGSSLRAFVRYDDVPLLPSTLRFLELGCSPGGTTRNLDYLESNVSCDDSRKKVLADPQTSGGLLMSVAEDSFEELRALADVHGESLSVVGYLEAGEPSVRVL